MFYLLVFLVIQLTFCLVYKLFKAIFVVVVVVLFLFFLFFFCVCVCVSVCVCRKI